ncbi:MAG: MATE family efflux transporter [Longimicrobiales bacterium]|jgi:putative MATE family efflux protein
MSTHPQQPDRLQQFLSNPRKALWVMALPMIAGMTVHTIYIIADTAFIGTLGTDALAAATFVAPLFFVIVAVTNALGTAVTALVAQAVGRQEEGGSDAAVGTALSVGVSAGVVMGVVGLLVGRRLLALLGAEGNVVQLGWEYFAIISAFLPLFFVSAVLRSILAGEGDARTPMLVLAIATVMNIALDALFILRMDMGIKGAALATILAVALSTTIFSVLLLRRKVAFVRLRLAALLPTREPLLQLFGLAAPIAGSMLIMSAGSMLYNWMLSDFGSIAVAAYGAASKVDMIVVLPIFGLSGAAVTVVGMFAGAGRADLVRSTALYTYRWAITLSVGVGAVAFVSSGPILQVFTDDPTAISMGATYLGFMIFSYPMMAVGMTTGRLLQGVGHGYPALLLTTLRVLLLGVPGALLAIHVFGQGIQGVWMGILGGGVGATILSVILVRRLVWLDDPTRKAAAG